MTAAGEDATRARLAHLEHGLRLIISESQHFPDEDGIGAGLMARRILAGAPVEREGAA